MALWLWLIGVHLCFYFNLWCGPSINFDHKPLLPLPCLHSNAIATPCLQSPWHEPNTPLSHLSICHQWLRGLSISPPDILIGSCCSDMHGECISSKWDGPVKDECRNAENGLLGLQFSPVPRGNPMKGGSCHWRISGKVFERSPVESVFLSLIVKWCNLNCLTHIHHLSATCIMPLWQTHSLPLCQDIAVQWCTTCMHVSDTSHVCKAPVTASWALPWYIKAIISPANMTNVSALSALTLHWYCLCVCHLITRWYNLTALGVFKLSLNPYVKL